MNNNCLKLFLVLIAGQMSISFAHVFFEGYAGGTLGRSKISSLKAQNIYGIEGLTACFDVPQKIKLSPSAMGGFKIGWWPNYCHDAWHQEYDHTPWRKHFGFYVDTQINNLEHQHHFSSLKICYKNNMTTATDRTDIFLCSRGLAISCAFLLAWHCGFLATDCVPFGRLQPYLAIGPAGLFTHQKTILTISPHQVDGSNLTVLLNNPYTIAPAKKLWARTGGFAIDSGIRYLTKHNFIFDFLFNYRFAPLHVSYKCAPQLSIKSRVNLFSFGMGAGYEF